MWTLFLTSRINKEKAGSKEDVMEAYAKFDLVLNYSTTGDIAKKWVCLLKKINFISLPKVGIFVILLNKQTNKQKKKTRKIQKV